MRFWAPETDAAREAVKRQLPSANAVMARPVEQVLRPVTRDEIAKTPVREGMPLAGIHRKVPVDMAEFGRWDSMPDGRRLWRAALHSPGAAGLRLHFEDFAAGAGRVWIHDGEGHIDGPYTGRGVFEDGDFWSETLFGNSITVEYEPAPGANGEVPFRINTVSHVFSGYFDVEKTDTAKEAAAPCHLDVACYPEWAETARSEARLVFEKDGGSYFCSGTLLNTRNSSRVPYFLTANHCIDTDAVARTVQAFWFYQAANCNGTAPNTRDLPRSNGSRLLATGDENQGDFTLLRLTDVPNGVYFSGWTPQEVALNTNLIGIHHPAGDYKRISFGARRSAPSAAGLLAPAVAYTVTWGEGHTEGGSSGSGLFASPGVLVGTLTGGLRPPAGRTKCDINPDSSFYGRFSAYYASIRDYLEDRTTAPSTPAAPTGAITLNSGVSQNFTISPVSSATLVSNPTYSIVVPAGATRLTVRLATSTSGADTDLYVRFGQAPAVSGGRVTADHQSTGAGGNESIVIDASSNPPLRPGTYFVSIGLFTTGVTVQGSITATLESGGGGTTPPPAGGVNQLTSGQSRSFSLSPVTGGTLFNSPSSMYAITVPAGATRLTVQVTTATPNADVDLHVRFGQAPSLDNRQIIADHKSDSDGGNESVTVVPTSNPPLRAGTYYIALALFTSGVAVQGTVVATVETGGGTTPPPTGGGSVALTSGTPREFTLPSVTSGTLFTSPTTLHSIQVPQGATRLTVRVQTTTPNADVDLYVRFNTPPQVQNQQIVADFRSVSDTGDETVTITPASSPALQAGTYYIALALFTNGVSPRGSITATVEGGGGSTPPPSTGGQPTQLTSGTGRDFQLAPVASATLFSAPSSMFTIQVPQNATRLTIRLNTATPGADVDLYARFGAAPDITGGRVTSDHSSTGDAGDETITVTSASSPGLRAGTYYIALALFTTGTAVRGTITATVEAGSATPPPSGAGPTPLTSNSPRQFDIASVQNPTLFNAPANLYTIDVPQGATRLQVRVNTATPNVDADLYVNFNSAPRVVDGRVQSDFRSETDGTGNETITITPASTPALRPGTYYIAMALFTTGTAVRGTITATVDGAAGTTPPPSGGRVLSSGQATPFQLASVSVPTLLGGEANYRITVPEGATRLQLRVTSADPRVDVDLYVRYGSPVEALNGSVVSDHSSESETGNETISITSASKPPLRPGVYYVALALYSVGAASSGTLTATVDREVPSIRTGTPLLPGQPVNAELPAASRPTFYSGVQGFHIEVPEGAPGLTVRLATVPGNVDLDLFVRQGREPELQDGRIVADYRSTGDAGDEVIRVTGASTPPLRGGTYFVGLANYTTGTAAQITLSADFTGSDSDSYHEVAKESLAFRKPKPVIQPLGFETARRGVADEAGLAEVAK